MERRLPFSTIRLVRPIILSSSEKAGESVPDTVSCFPPLIAILNYASRMTIAVKNLVRAISARVWIAQRDNSRRWIYTRNKVTLACDATGARCMEM